ncbi:MAG: DNA cytosine methyltransferase [Acetobacter sp.]|uniref:DNA cytosine methyltransferase n=1 Tax=Acetobacter sp. TaxID=440 RepID=UPI0039EC44CC
MNRMQPMQWGLDTGINVVLFAGLGGACAGLEDAGLPVHVANNHDPVALAAHAALFPHTRHVKGDIFDVDPIEATGGQPVNLLWASPDCRDHSIAKGAKPRSARVRSLPWQVCRWAGKTRPQVIIMENVREIRGWGPLVAKRDRATGRVIKLDGTVAAKGEHVPLRQQQLVRDRQRAGRTYRAFIRHLSSLGYQIEARDLCCADFGIPTIRRRWFAVARRDGRPIRWPEQTHTACPAKTSTADRRLLPWVNTAAIIDWSLPMPSIFERKRPLAENTNRRIAVGLRKFVLENPRPFIIPVCHSRNLCAQDGNEPLRTITTEKGGGFAIVAPTLLLGDRCVQAAAWMVQQNYTVEQGVIGAPLTRPVSTLTTRGTQQAVAAAYMVKLRGTGTAGPLTEPLPTVTAGGHHEMLVSAFMVKYYGTAVGQPLQEPLSSVTTRDRHGLVAVSFMGEPAALADIGMRMLQPHEAAAAHELTLPDLITVDGVTRKLTTTEAMRLIGNSVPKRMAHLLAEANNVMALYAPQERNAA